MKLILLGPPGSGKGTVATRIIQDYSLKHIAPGDIFREEVKKDSPMGKKVKELIEAGSFVPDEITIELVRSRLAGDFVLDGYPRTLGQAEAIADVPIDKVLNFVIDLDKLIERLSGRWICETCGTIYHTKTMPPPQEGVCTCGGKLIQRKDDQPQSIKQRFKMYTEKTAPLIDYYKQKGLLVDIDASGSPDEEYALVKQALAKLS